MTNSKRKKRSTSHNKKYIFTICGIHSENIDRRYNITLVSNLTDKDHIPSTRVTKITDLANDKRTPDIISFLDESKRLHKCIVSMVNYTRHENVRMLDYNCFWDRHSFRTTTIGCPIKYVASQAVKNYYSEISRDRYTIKENITSAKRESISDTRLDIDVKDYYETDGAFCSFNCCMAYIRDNKHNPFYIDSESLLLKIYVDMYGITLDLIECAPHWRLLKEYGGHMTIEEFRKTFNKMEYDYHGHVRQLPKFHPIGTIFEECIKF